MEENKQLNEKEYLDFIKQWKEENKELIKSGKCRKVFLEVLPRWEKGEGSGKIGNINWIKSKYMFIHFIFNTIEGDLEIVGYKNRAIYIKYMESDVSKIYSGALKECKLDTILKLRTSDFKIEIGTRFKDEKRDIIITNREYRHKKRKDKKNENQKWYKYICYRCGWNEGWIEESNLLGKRKVGCSCCAGKIVVEGINDIPTTTPWLIPYFQGGIEEAKLYTKCGGGNPNNPRGNIYPICPDCRKTSKISTSIYNIFKHEGFGCSCSDGVKYPNKFAFNLLEQLNVEFISEYNPDWIKPRKYDFYFKVNNKEFILEMDGGIGHGNNNDFDNRNPQESKAIDNYKDEQASIHGIEVIRIDCDYEYNRFEYIKNNIFNNKKLNSLFNLNQINWLKCHKYALSNKIKMVCELWDNGIHSTVKIAETIKMSRGVVINYLNQGALIGWCNYNAKEETIKGSSYSGKLKRKQIIMLKDDFVLGIFSSAHELDRKSNVIFNIKFEYGSICKACRENKVYKGFIFKYIENLTLEEYIKYDIENKLKELNKSA